MRIGWIGSHREGIPALRSVLEEGTNIVGVITLNEIQAARRSGTADYSSICQQYNVPLYRVDNINDSGAIEILNWMDLDVAIVLGWSQIILPAALASARIGMIGAHASLLPSNRGSAPVNWALIRGERHSGNTLIWLANEVDGGKIIDQRRFELTPYDTCATVYDKVAESNREMVMALLPKLVAGERPGRVQTATDQPLLPRRRPADGLIDWRRGSEEIYNFVRGLTRPYPGAFGYLAGQKWTIWRAALLPAGLRGHTLAGDVVGSVISPDEACCGQLVACGSGQLLVLEVEDEAGTVYDGHKLSELTWKGAAWRQAA